jgi:hypothetical protein
MLGLASALNATAISQWLRQSAWAYPSLETLHILGLALLVGSIAVVDLAVLRRARDSAFLNNTLRITLFGFTMAALTGSLMLLARPMDLLLNPLLQIKLVLLVVAGLNAMSFHWRGGFARMDKLSQIQALLSLGFWITIIALGRWVAYI